MTMNRRTLIIRGAAVLLAARARPASAQAAPVLIEMKGSPRGERVAFVPSGVGVAPGTVVRFVNRDAGNSHTATTYHPDILDRPQRIPDAAQPWDSDLLLPEDAFEVTLTVPGVYDFYCVPHEHAGMVGRIVVGTPDDTGWQGPATDPGDLPDAALAAFAAVDVILAQGAVLPPGGDPT
ncbi:cupredoxin domain-containing protein [Paracoccus alkenifer]|nr:plastocyanin/azurin family copper-binding protein [Paracoccus alkenifer]